MVCGCFDRSDGCAAHWQLTLCEIRVEPRARDNPNSRPARRYSASLQLLEQPVSCQHHKPLAPVLAPEGVDFSSPYFGTVPYDGHWHAGQPDGMAHLRPLHAAKIADLPIALVPNNVL